MRTWFIRFTIFGDEVAERFGSVLVHHVQVLVLLEIVFKFDAEFAFGAVLEHFNFIHGQFAHWVVCRIPWSHFYDVGLACKFVLGEPAL